MGVFKRLKEQKEIFHQLPDMVEEGQKLAQRAQQLQAAQAQAAQAQAAQMQAAQGGPAAAGAIDPALLEPIAGISLERYAQLAKSLGERRLDQAEVESFVKLQGHAPEEWQAAHEGWNARFKGNMALAVHYGNLYQQARAL